MKAFMDPDFILGTKTAEHLFHDYFRRILCNLIGGWVENGEYPNDEEALKRIVQGISFDNEKRYFNLPL